MDRHIQVNVRENGGQMLITVQTAHAESLSLAIDAPLHVPEPAPKLDDVPTPKPIEARKRLRKRPRKSVVKPTAKKTARRR